MLLIRLKQCEVALSGGRLDEAFTMLAEPAMRGHRRGQELMGEVGKALVARGRQHLAAGSLEAAASDADRAATLGGNLAEVVQLRRAVSTAMAEQRKANQVRDHVISTARKRVDVGQLTVGQQLIEETVVGNHAELLKQDIAAKRASVESAVDKAKVSLKSDDWEAAIEHVARLDRSCRAEPAVREIIGRIDEKVVAQVTESIEAGRLDVGASLLSRLARLPSQSPESDNLRRIVSQCREAFEAIGRGDATGADLTIRALLPLLPKAKWLASVADLARTVRQATEELRTGPLRLATLSAAPVALAPAPAHAIPQPPPLPNSSPVTDVILHVDGAGGFRVVDRPIVSIGPVSSSRRVDVPLLADATLPTITIARSEEDYFLHSAQPVLVNDRPTTSTLLSSGDRIGLGPRCRITFRRPSPASTSAVLDLSGTRLPQADVRHIVLMDREMIVGPGAAAHIRSDELDAPAVIQRRDGQLVCRAQGKTTPLQPGAHVQVGPIGLVVAKEA